MNKTNIELVSKLGVIASRLSSITDIPTLSTSMNDIVDSIIVSKYNGLYFYNEDKQKLELHLAKNFTKEEMQIAEATAMDRHIGWVFRNNEVLLVNDTKKENSPSIESKRSFVVRSRLWLPILCLDKVVGVFGMASTKPNMYNKEHVALVSFVCDLAGVVFNNIVLENRQKKINENLQKSKVQFETLFESFPDAIFIHDFEKITNINSSFKKLFNYPSKEEVLGKVFIDELIYYEDKSEGKTLLDREKNKSTTFIPQLRLKKKGGAVFLAEVHILLIFLDDRPHIQVTVRDITERKKIEEQLKKEEQKSMLLRQAEQVPGIIYQCKMKSDGTTTFPFVSGKMLNLFNTSSEAVIEGRDKLFNNIYREDKKLFESSILNSRKTLKNWSLDYRIELPGNRIKWMRGNSKPILMSDESIIWHGYITDITEHKLAEEALEDSEKQISTMFEHAPDAILVIDNRGVISKWNPKAEQIFGWKKEEVTGKNMTEVIVPKHFKKRLLKVLKRFIKKGTDRNHGHSLEWSALNKNGKEFPIALAISEMTIKGEQFFIGFISDITKRKNNEAKIKQSLIEKDVLLKEIHHRIKNNMQVITSLLSLQSSFVEQKNIKELFLSSQYRIHSMGIVHEMLYQSDDLSKINFGDYLTQLTDGLIKAMKGKRHKIKLEIDCPVLSLNLDTAIPLGLITNELITNSLKYGIKENNEGRISIRVVKLDYPHFRIEIGDNGPGYSKGFNFRTSKSLGLMLVHKLSKQLLGKTERNLEKPGANYILHFQELQ